VNENGYSWAEAILTLTIVVVIFGTLLPFVTKMASMLHEKKLGMYAAETAYQGTIAYDAYRIKEGIRQVESAKFEWLINGNSICVFYLSNDKVSQKCVDY
jgi:hypothetical protein